MALKLGLAAKLYYDAAGVGVGTWSELTNVRDVTVNLEKGEADVTTRANNGWRASVGTLNDASIEFEMVYDTADAGFTALQTAFFSGTTIGIAAMDGAIATTGTQGLQADCSVINFTKSEPLEEAQMVSVTVKPTYSTTAPAWVTIP